MDGGLVVVTLSYIVTLLQQNVMLSAHRRRDLISAVLRICEITGVDPRTTPASLQFMRPLISKIHPAKHDLTPKTLSNLRSNFRAALVHALPRTPRHSDPEWERLRATLPNSRMKIRLSRLIGFCEHKRISPSEVNDEVIGQFLAHLESDKLTPSPHDCHRRTCRLWNEAVDSVPNWPQGRVSLPDYRAKRRALPLSAYPARVGEEFMQCVAPPQRGQRFAFGVPRKSLRPSTIRKMKTEIELALTALVESGRDPDSIASLTCLFEPDLFEIVLTRYLNDDEEETPRPTARNIANTLIGFARRMLGSDPAALVQIAELRRLQRYLGPERTGLTEKNRRLLREFSDPAVLGKLLLLPERLANSAQRATPRRGAVAMELAVAIAILTVAPMRIANLASLRLDQHLVRSGGPRSLWLIEIPPQEVKNGAPLLYELSSRVTAMVDRYLRNFRSRLAQPGNTYLFPFGASHKGAPGFSHQIRGVIADWVGIDMSPHQFRHLAGLLMQKNNPGNLRPLPSYSATRGSIPCSGITRSRIPSRSAADLTRSSSVKSPKPGCLGGDSREQASSP
jgi:hypothetical protein